MSDSTPESVIAVHMPYDWCGGMWECVASDCGFDSSDSGTPSADFATHVLEALAAHRMTVVTLPEPDSTSGKGSIWVTPVEDVRTTVFGEVVVGASWWVQPYAARKFAAALLAAADAAEEER